MEPRTHDDGGWMLKPLRPRFVAMALVAWQLAAIVSTPLALCVVRQVSQTSVECTCEHMPGAFCPMHDRHPSSEAGAGSRWCAGCGESALALVKVLTGFTGLAPEPQAIGRPAIVSSALSLGDYPAADVHRSPDLPPPRV